jgi:hypothetical protein
MPRERIKLLRIANYEYYLYSYTKTGSDYLGAHEILSELEKKVCCNNILHHDPEIGGALFKLNRITRDGVHKYIVYDFIKVI